MARESERSWSNLSSKETRNQATCFRDVFQYTFSERNWIGDPMAVREGRETSVRPGGGSPLDENNGLHRQPGGAASFAVGQLALTCASNRMIRLRRANP